MISVFSSTNRPNSLTAVFAQYAFNAFKEQGAEVQYFSLEDLPANIFHPDMYEAEHQSPELAAIQDKFIIPIQKFYFVIPEYNGSFPGVLKYFWDACSIREYKASFQGGKKAGLLGVSAGRAGNLRGLDHFTGALNYLQINVMPNRQPISGIESLVDEHRQIKDEATRRIISKHVEQFINF